MPHIHKDIDFVVSAYIFMSGRVLLIFHRELQLWLPIGGHIELNEDPEEALFREIKEETGLLSDDLTILTDKLTGDTPGNKFLYRPNFMAIHNISASHRHTALIYVLRSRTFQIALAENEHEQIKWYSLDEIDRLGALVPSEVKLITREAAILTSVKS